MQPAQAVDHDDDDDHGPEVAGLNDDGGEEQPEPAAEEQEKMSSKALKKVFDLLRQEHTNTAAFANSLLEQRKLQKQLRMIVDVLQFLHQEYMEDGKAHAAGQEATTLWQGKRAMGAWYSTIARTVELLQSPSMAARLDLKPMPFSLDQQPLSKEDPAVQEDLSLVRQLYGFVVDLCANRAWSQAFHIYLFPYCAAALLSNEPGAEGKVRGLATSLLQLEEKVQDLPRAAKQHPLQELYQDIGTSSWQIVRELLCTGQQAQWNPVKPELRALLLSLFGGTASTREPLESAFAWLKDSLRSKATKVSVWTRWFYLLTNPYVREGGVDQIFPSAGDFQQLLADGFRDDALLSAHPFEPLKSSLGDDFPQPDKVEGVRPAGYLANRTAAAAMALAAAAASSNFTTVDKAWAGKGARFR